MLNLIINNAYRILGLDSNANQKDILQRYKEIINRLKIDDYPEYNLDINLSGKIRTEESVNNSLKKLQNIKNNLNEYFFWFNISDTVDENAFEQLQYNDAASYDKAIQIWKNASNTDNSVGLLYKKNLALLYCLMLVNEENDDYLTESLSNWKEIIDSDKFWTAFEKSHAVNNDQITNSALITDFRKNIVKHISDIYHDLYHQYENKKYVKDFQDVFETFGKKTEENLLKPIYQSIYDTIKELDEIVKTKNNKDEEKEIDIDCDNCKISLNQVSHKTYVDGSILCEGCHRGIGTEWEKRIKKKDTVEYSNKKIQQIQKEISKLKFQLVQLIEIGLYEDDQSKVVRDHTAEAIRSAAVMIYNDLDMKAKSFELIDMAKTIAGTKSVKVEMETDLKTIKESIEQNEENTLTFEIDGFFRNKELIIENDFIEYNLKKIYYKDVFSIAYYPNNEEFTIVIDSFTGGMKVKFNNWDNFSIAVNRIVSLTESIIVDKLIKLIFEEGETVTIGKIGFDRTGYHSSNVFRGKSVLWGDDHVSAQMIDGKILLYEYRDNQSKEFASISLEELNAVILPSLIDTCFKEYYIRSNNKFDEK